MGDSTSAGPSAHQRQPGPPLASHHHQQQPSQQQQQQQQPQQPVPLSSVAQQLLLCQIVCQTGSRDWHNVCRLVEGSKYLGQDARARVGITAEVCATRFQQLVKASGLQYIEPLEPNARTTRKVIRNLYAKSLHQALSLVHTRLKEERRIAAEIDAIKAGKLDSQLIASAPPDVRNKILEARERKKNGGGDKVASSSGGAEGEAEGSKSQETGAAARPAENTVVVTSGTSSAAADSDKADKGKSKAAAEPDDDGDVKMVDDVAPLASKATEKDSAGRQPKSEDAENEGGALTESASRDVTPATVRRSGRRAATVEEESVAEDGETPQADGENEEGAESEAGDEQEDEDGGRRTSRRRSGAAASRARRNKRKTSEPANSPPLERSTKRVKTEDEQQAADSARFRKAITLLLSRLDDEPSINMFKQAVKRSDAPAYPEAVKRPMWLQQVVSRVKKGVTTNEVELMRDMALLCANAIQFNGKDDSVGKQAAELWSKFESLMEEHLSRFRGDDN
ncbi:hypothetical protein ACM66B_001838 [Microbotryomycetes sp. NB124-2]